MSALLALGIIVLIGLGLEKLYEYNWRKGIRVKVKFSKNEAQVGDSIEIHEKLSNTKGIFLPFISLKYDVVKNGSVAKTRSGVFSLSYKQKVTRHIDYLCSQRGCYNIGSTYVVFKGFLLRQTLECTVPQCSKLVVYPKLTDVSQIPIYALLTEGDQIHNPRIIEDRLAFRDIREYVDTDSINRINWNATARTDELMVNTYDDCRRAAVRIVMELPDRYYEEAEVMQEEAISLASSIYVEMLRQGVPVSFASNGSDAYNGEVVSLPERSDAAYEKEVLESMARIGGLVDDDVALGAVSEDLPSHATVILISPVGDMCKGLKSQVMELATAGCKVLWVVMYSKRDTLALEEARKKIENYGLENRVLIYEWEG